MSAERQTGELPLFRMFRGTKLRGTGAPLHGHDEAQLIFAASGTIQVYTPFGRWLVPPQFAVWVPAGVLHGVDMLSDAELWMVYWQSAAARAWAPSASLDRAFALRVTPLLRTLIFAVLDAAATPGKTELVVRLILHELVETQDAPTFLPLPTSAIGKRVTDLAFADPQSHLDLEEIASRAATSVRTISRLFPAETGLTFKAWRQRARIVRAIDQLSGGCTIAQVASHAGFSSTAAFCFAFQQVTQTTPSAFLEQAAR